MTTYRNITPPSPATTIAELNTRLADLQTELWDTQARINRANRRVQATWGLAVAGGVFLFVCGHNPQAIAQGFGVTLASLASRVTDMETKTASLSVLIDPNTGKATARFSGVNVQIVNGTGNTDTNGTGNGVGNLIIGYNELRNDTQSPDVRTGSHNLVGGKGSNYAGAGGAVLGLNNSMSGSESSVLGGYGNTVSGLADTVSGGQGNTAMGSFASVSGGLGNVASGIYASVSGGQANTASSTAASVSGGLGNLASGPQSSVTGGQLNTASGNSSSVNGGLYVRPATAGWSWAAGGSYGPAGGTGVFHSP